MTFVISVSGLILTSIILTSITIKKLNTLLKMKKVAEFEPLSNTPHPLLGKKAPNFTLSSADQNQYHLDQLLEGESGILLIVVDTHCPFCNSHLERFIEDVKKYPPVRSVLLVTESEGESVDRIQKLYGEQFFILAAPDHIVEEYHVEWFPTYYYINEDRVVEHVSEHSTEMLTYIFSSKSKAS